MARSPRLVCVLAGRRVRPGSRRPRVERGVWSGYVGEQGEG